MSDSTNVTPDDLGDDVEPAGSDADRYDAADVAAATVPPVGPDPETATEDSWEHARAADDPLAVGLPDDVEVPVADAWEQAQPAGDVDDDY